MKKAILMRRWMIFGVSWRLYRLTEPYKKHDWIVVGRVESANPGSWVAYASDESGVAGLFVVGPRGTPNGTPNGTPKHCLATLGYEEVVP